MNIWKLTSMLGLVLLTTAQATLLPGDIVFVGFDGDGTDALAFMTMVDLPAQTDLHFCDAPWDGTAFGTKEGEFVWNSGTSVVPAGSVVFINDVAATVPSASLGSVTVVKDGGLGSSGENVFVFEGTASRIPTRFIAGITTDATTWNTLLGTGLTPGYTAIQLPKVAVAQYIGPRSGLGKAALLVELNKTVNWSTTGTDISAGTAFAVDAAALPTIPTVAFAAEYKIVKENAGSVDVQVTLSHVTSVPVGVDVRLAQVGTAKAGTHMDFQSTRLVFPVGEKDAVITIPVHTSTSEADRYFALLLENVNEAVVGKTAQHIVYVQKEKIKAPTATNALQMEWLGRYAVTEGGTAEIVAYHAGKKRLYVLNSTKSRVDILDMSNPQSIVEVAKLDMSAYGIGATSIAVKGDWIVATIDAGPEANGKIVFLDVDGKELKVLEVGSLPDMVTFTPDGKWVLTANEGQPKSDYTVDAEGSLSMIDVSGGLEGLTQAQVFQIGFADFNNQKDALAALGLRVFGKYNGGVSSLAQDVEPEYITVSDDSKTAWVTLQENNAIAVVDLTEKKVTRIIPLGYKDHSLPGNELDASDKTSAPLFVNWPVYGVYMPDAIAQYTVGNQTYIVTANEGDAREYSALVEDHKVKGLQLNSATFLDGKILQSDMALGRLAVVGCQGLPTGVQDRICAMGARSFSIWNASTGALVYDSGSDLERITAADPKFGHLFNASHESNAIKNRSDNKGPEPEGVALGKIGEKTYAFITLERMGGVVAYDVSNPAAPVFESYVNSRDVNAYGGDQGAEGVIFISAMNSPTGRALVVTANEISGTVAVFGLNDTYTAPAEPTPEPTPDPVAVALQDSQRPLQWEAYNNGVYFSRPTSVSVLDTRGSLLERHESVAWISLSDRVPGTYLLRISDGRTIPVLRSEP